MRDWLYVATIPWFAVCSWACFDIKDVASPEDDDTGDAAGSWDTREDHFVVTPAAPLDVLFVVDNSGAMLEAQNRLINSISGFFEQLEFSGIDFHVGLTVLDDYEDQPPIGQLWGSPLFIDAADVNPAILFEGSMDMGCDGWGNCEAGLMASHLALDEPLVSGHNTGFYRQEANLVVVVLSNEDDASAPGSECTHPQDYIGDEEFAGWFADLKSGAGLGVHFVAIVGPADTGCSFGQGDAGPGDGYLDVVELLGDERATFLSYCENEWTEPLANIAEDVVAADLAYQLSGEPVDGTLRVYVDPDAGGAAQEASVAEDPSNSSPYAYAYDAVANQILFWAEASPPCGATVRVSYQVMD